MIDRKEYFRKWRNSHPDYLNVWRRNNPEKVKEHHIYKRDIGATKCRSAVKRSIKNGSLPSLSKNIIQCSYCNERAIHYDHRDYNKPLDVKPVCGSCNRKLGKAIPSRPKADLSKNGQTPKKMQVGRLFCYGCGCPKTEARLCSQHSRI